MKVFISHSMQDQDFFNGIDNTLKMYGIELLLAEHKIDLKNSISNKIKLMIEECHMGLILLTKDGIKSGFVREEIGYLEAKNKPNLIIFEKGVEKEYGGFKYGHEFLELDTEFPDKTIEKVKQILINHRNKLLAQQEAEKVKGEKNFLIGIGIVAGLLILGSSN